MASLQFPTLAAAARATPLVLREGPSAVELLDHVAIEHARANRFWRDSTAFVHGDPAALLLVEWSGTAEEVAERLAAAEAIGREVGAEHVTLLPDAADQAQTVHLRASILPLLLGPTDSTKPVAFVEDAAVRPERLEEFVVRFEELLEGERTWACFYGHASVGCLHIRPALDTRDPDDVARMRRIAERVADLVIELGGSLSGEHGDGLSRSEFLERMYGPQLIGAFAELKAAWDPDGLLNPGVIVHPARMDADLRVSPDRHGGAVPTKLDFGRQGSFISAIELCNGTAQCRKIGTGSMCPSFMVTRDERDTTRARANALRSVLDGTLPMSELTGEALREVMDLCVGCKACVSECPSSVDVASMKIEVLAQSGAAHGFSLRQRAAGSMRRSLELAGHAPGSSTRSPRPARRDEPPRRSRASTGAGACRMSPRGRSQRDSARCPRAPAPRSRSSTTRGRTTSARRSARPPSASSPPPVRASCSPRSSAAGARCSARASSTTPAATRPATSSCSTRSCAAACRSPASSRAASSRSATTTRACCPTIRASSARRRDPAIRGGAARARPTRAAARRPGGPARALPPEGARRRGPHRAGSRAGSRHERPDPRQRMLRHGRPVRLRARALRRVDADGRARALPGGARRGGADLVAPGTSCREQIADGTGRQALHPAQSTWRGCWSRLRR